MQHVSLSLLNEGIVVSQRERENVVVLVLLHPESMCVCYDTANSLSLNRDPPNQAHNVCV